jgi:hypothetical protein
MPRRKSVNLIRDVGVDPLYGSPVVQKLINVVMWRGKKNAARTIVYDALGLLGKKAGGGQEKALRAFKLQPSVLIRQWVNVLAMSSLLLQRGKAVRLKRSKMCIKWPKQIAPSLNILGRLDGYECSITTFSQYRYCGAY